MLCHTPKEQSEYLAHTPFKESKYLKSSETNEYRLMLRSTLPYLQLIRADAPIGYWLLLWPCWLAVALTSPLTEDMLTLLLLFLLGAIVMRGAGCIFNDIVDRHFDALVARTQNRPIATGQVSVLRAVLFMAGLSLAGLLVLLQLNYQAVFVGLCSIPLIAAYPFMKRITWWPQLWLGLTFNWGVLVAWAAVRGSIDWQTLVLYGSGIAWTLGYDTIYAHQDKVDDILIGVKSSALRLGQHSRLAICAFYSLTMLGLTASALLADLAWPAYAGLIIAGVQLAWQTNSVDFDDPDSCLTMFKSNHFFAAIVFSGFLVG